MIIQSFLLTTMATHINFLWATVIVLIGISIIALIRGSQNQSAYDQLKNDFEDLKKTLDGDKINDIIKWHELIEKAFEKIMNILSRAEKRLIELEDSELVKLFSEIRRYVKNFREALDDVKDNSKAVARHREAIKRIDDDVEDVERALINKGYLDRSQSSDIEKIESRLNKLEQLIKAK